METTKDFLAAVAQQHGLTSDYQISKFLKISRQRVCKYQAGKSTLGDETALIVADALERDRGYVLACIAAERANEDGTRRAWESIARKLSPAVAAAFIAAVLLPLAGLPSDAHASAATRTLYIMLNRAMRLFLTATKALLHSLTRWHALPYPQD